MSKARGLADLGNVYSDGALSNRNMIINGAMQVDQRNGGAAVTAGSSGVFVVDRIRSENGTSTGTITGQQSTLGNSKSAKLTATAAVTDLTTNKYVHGLYTRLEAQDVYHLNGQTVTLSFVVETNWTGNLPVNIRNHDSSRSYVVDAAVVSGTNNVSVSLTLEAATVDAIDNGTGLQITIGFNNEATHQTATTDAWVAGNFLTSTASTQWAKTTGNFINVTNLQLELGDTATPFEHRSYGDELARCFRYYSSFKQDSGETTFGASIAFNSTAAYDGMVVSFPVQMRAVPTRSSSGAYSVSDGLGGAFAITGFYGEMSKSGYQLGFAAASGLTTGRLYLIRAANGSGSKLNFDAEL